MILVSSRKNSRRVGYLHAAYILKISQEIWPANQNSSRLHNRKLCVRSRYGMIWATRTLGVTANNSNHAKGIEIVLTEMRFTVRKYFTGRLFIPVSHGRSQIKVLRRFQKHFRTFDLCHYMYDFDTWGNVRERVIISFM